MISKTKLQIMEIAGRMEVGYARDYAILTGQKEYTATRKRLAELCREGLMIEKWRNGKKIYYMSAPGLQMIESHMKKPYNPGGYTTDHSLYVAELAAYLTLKHQITNDSFVFDLEMKNLGIEGKKHAPDLVVGGICYEVELNQKEKSRLKSNVAMNAERFVKQVWIVPDHLKALRVSLKNLSTKKCPVIVGSLERICEYLERADIHKNNLERKIEPKIKERTVKSIKEELQ